STASTAAPVSNTTTSKASERAASTAPQRLRQRNTATATSAPASTHTARGVSVSTAITQVATRPSKTRARAALPVPRGSAEELIGADVTVGRCLLLSLIRPDASSSSVPVLRGYAPLQSCAGKVSPV